MNHQDHVALIRDGVSGGGRSWVELGSGRGAFTLALAELLEPRGDILSVDRDAAALRRQEQEMRLRFPHAAVTYRTADFVDGLDLPRVDGILMANSLHFVTDKLPLLRRLRSRVREAGRFLLVEYEADRGNPWVPHPISYARWEQLAAEAGFARTRRLSRVPSRFLGEIYSALSE